MPQHLAESRLELPAPHDFSSLRRASAWLAEHAKQHDIPSEQLDHLDIFLNEALANVLDHGGSGALAAAIQLLFDINRQSGNNRATLTVIDAGTAFDPLAFSAKPRPQSLDEATPGGLGIQMMRSFADDLNYRYQDGHNHLAFTVSWQPSTGTLAAQQTQRFGHGPDRRKSNIEVENDRRSAEDDRRKVGMDWFTLFRGANEKEIQETIKDSEVLLLPAGTPLLKPGDANDSIFILLSGHLAAHLDSDLNPDAALQIAPGECIGELSAIDGKPVSALVLAVDDVRVLKLTQAVFWNKLLTIPGVARNLLVSLSERMRRTNEAVLEHQRKQLALQHLRKELEVARQLQASMLPLRRPMFPERNDVEVAALMEPASEVGGDFFDAFFIDQDHLFICIGDVSGHGIPAALFMARCIGLMRIAAMSTLQPGELIEKINDQLCAGNETNLFVTLFCGFFNIASGRLVYSNGGHCAPIILNRGNASRLPIPKGTLVGAIPGLAYSSREITLSPDDALVCFTDGITEAQPASGEEFSEERLVDTLQKNCALSLEDMLDSIHREVTTFTGDNALDDDYTLLVVRRHSR